MSDETNKEIIHKKPPERLKYTHYKPKLTTELIEQLTTFIKGSAYIEQACYMIGLSPYKLAEWLREGRELQLQIQCGQRPYRQLSKRKKLLVLLWAEINKTLAEAEYRDQQILEWHVSQGDFKALQYRMDKRYSKKMGTQREETVDETGMFIESKDAQHLVGDESQSTSKEIEPAVIDYTEIIGESAELSD